MGNILCSKNKDENKEILPKYEGQYEKMYDKTEDLYKNEIDKIINFWFCY